MGLKMIETDVKDVVAQAWINQGGKLPEHEGIQYAESRVDDAFSTILQWLQWRIPFTRGAPRPGAKFYPPNITVNARGRAVATFAYPTEV